MHSTVTDLVRRMREKYPGHFKKSRVLELGSRNINGTVRDFFSESADYVGIDCHGGKGVDVVGIAHEYDQRDDGYFDVVVTTEMLEHDPYWEQTLEFAARMLRSGGLFILTCAGPSRGAHHPEDSPIPGYYGNRTVEELESHLPSCCGWEPLHVNYVRNNLDLHAYGVKL